MHSFVHRFGIHMRKRGKKEPGAAKDEQDEEEDDAASGADDEVDEDGEGRGERPQAARSC